jgi:hypothetical protein
LVLTTGRALPIPFSTRISESRIAPGAFEFRENGILRRVNAVAVYFAFSIATIANVALRLVI